MADDSNLDDDDIASKFEGLRERTRDLTSGSNAFARAITSAFAQGATGAKSFDTVLKSLAQRLSTLSLNLALKPVTNLLSGGIEKLFEGLGGGFANAQPFARGGVIASPSYFPLGNG